MVYHNSSGLPYSPSCSLLSTIPTSLEDSEGHTCSDVEATMTPCYWLSSAECYYCLFSVTLNLAHIHIFTAFVSQLLISYIFALYLTVTLLWLDGETFPLKTIRPT